MREALEQIAHSLVQAGLAVGAGEDAPLVAALDEGCVWNRQPVDPAAWNALFEAAPGSALVCIRPAGAYGVVIRHLVRQAMRQGATALQPADSETRTFLHDIPVAPSLEAAAVAGALSRRKGCIVLDGDAVPLVLAAGALTPGQAAVTVSCICFATFVQFFVDALLMARLRGMDRATSEAVAAAFNALPAIVDDPPRLMTGPFEDPTVARAAMMEAGRVTVTLGLVDSCFGNVSYVMDTIMHISQTGAALDALEDAIDACPLTDDPALGASTAGITASSECAAHQAVIEQAMAGMPETGCRVRAILHGHPRFAVILSMDCPGRGTGNESPCPDAEFCQIRCPRSRYLEAEGCPDIPVVPGEVGTGPTGLCQTVPVALAGRRGAMVFGHGLFTADPVDFNGALATLLEVENACRREVARRLAL
ncbi:class II aldolase/adducin family protein [Megalodesulfovibrio gigas]|uniref:Putative class II aldolase/adducin family protein n=1 Tax=Megalodesulfovibrio gigas (strain ATCC 19364 / DSM 1382 / NCIMB 9332 / VKM B-1759) TaxID=1121448 RepID=T2GBK3_MEGG1|nr:class II aldolase/adducin family protein [Megalodesulfovibrio gigas]AGW13292.1 putative class II aldolase/adducin family protein [Megalodesulfovibrio gigas DSM 1382 = ATCC 19364]